MAPLIAAMSDARSGCEDAKAVQQDDRGISMTNDRKHIAVIGSRGFANPGVVRAFVADLPKDTVVVSGAARGVDTWAEEAAEAAGIATLIFHADWDGLGRRAGPIRNEQIIAAADEVVAFWDGTSRGTLNAVYLATEKGIPVRVLDTGGWDVPIGSALEVASELGVIDALVKARSKNADM